MATPLRVLLRYQENIVWISAGQDRVGFETKRGTDAEIMYQAICILVERAYARPRVEQ